MVSGLGQVVRAYRQARGLSSRALAAAAGIAPQTLWFIEHGVTQQPRPENLAAIARALNIPPPRLQALATGATGGSTSSAAPFPPGGLAVGTARPARRAVVRPEQTEQQGMGGKWVTRAGVRLDRAAMVWLIKKMVDPEAEIVILPESEVLEYAVETGATPFHHPKADLRNTGTRTGFDALRTHHDLADPALAMMSLILRGAETNDRSLSQWSAGFWAIGDGLRQLTDDDETFIARLAPVLDGLYRFCQDQLAPAPRRERVMSGE
jgi:transcriptional regulator with XRE-family HTH domain